MTKGWPVQLRRVSFELADPDQVEAHWREHHAHLIDNRAVANEYADKQWEMIRGLVDWARTMIDAPCAKCEQLPSHYVVALLYGDRVMAQEPRCAGCEQL